MSDSNHPEVRMASTVKSFIDNSEIKDNGRRDIPKAVFMEAMEKHGVDKKMLDAVHQATGAVTTAAASVAVHDLENKIKAADPEQLKDPEFRKGMGAEVVLPTLGGTTEVEVRMETISNIPFRGEGEGPATKTTYGRIKTSINTKRVIHKDFHAEARDKIRAALGVVD